MIRRVIYGPHIVKPWFPSPGYIDLEAKSLKSYRCKEPRTVWQGVNLSSNNTKDPEIDLYLCPKCLLYSSVQEDIEQHQKFCRYKAGPPGVVVYSDSDFEIRKLDTDMDGDGLKLYMQCIALFGRMFLDTKSICFALEGFWLYAAYEKKTGLLAGFFSREKQSWHDYNLACIVVFPPFQGMGLGQLLIGYSYYLSRLEHTVGSPEQPLSEFGRKSYMSYWKREISRLLASKAANKLKTILDISNQLGIDPADVTLTLKNLGALKKSERGRVELDVAKVTQAAENSKAQTRGFDEHYVVT